MLNLISKMITTAIKINPTSLTLMVTSLALISVLKQFS